MNFAGLLESVDRRVLSSYGETVAYQPGTGSPVTVTGVFDAAYKRDDVGEAGVSTSEPAVFLRLADLPSDPRADSPIVTIRTVAYAVREVEPDGEGGIRLFLQEEA